MAVFIINGDPVSQTEWKALLGNLPFPYDPVFEDKKLTSGELEGLLHRYHHNAAWYDDRVFDRHRWHRIETVLGRHGFAASRAVQSPSDVFKILERSGIEQLSFVSPELRANASFMLDAVRLNPKAVHYADSSLLEEPSFRLAAAKINPLSLRCWERPSRLALDESFWLQAMQITEEAYRWVPQDLRTKPDFRQKVVRLNKPAAEYALDSHWPDEDGFLWREQFKVRVDHFDEGAQPLQNLLWPEVKAAYDWEKVLPEADLNSYAAWKQAIEKRYGIEFLQRFHYFETLYSVLDLRKHHSASANEPLAIYISPKSDWNGAFEQGPLLPVERLRELGYQVFYYEVASEEEVAAALRDAVPNPLERKADVLILGGHGTSSSLNLDQGLGVQWPVVILKSPLLSSLLAIGESWDIDISDFSGSKPDLRLNEYLEPDGDLVLESCSNGEGGVKNPDNLANRVAGQIPNATVHSTQIPDSIWNIYKDKQGRLQVQWATGVPPYVVKEKGG